jgi:hypothetical protein
MKTAYFDCFNGAGGDMIVASLIDAGADADAIRRGLDSLQLTGYSLSISRVQKQGFAATRFHVELSPSEKQPHRHLKDVVQIINRGDLSSRVRELAVSIFTRLAEAEAAVHGTSAETVHFHEVGAVDAILDIVGAALAIETLGVERTICSAIPTGSGTVVCQHGTLPVPAPATVQLLRGVPVVPGQSEGELTTPTAAAVLTTLAEQFGPLPPMRLASVGYGAGSREGTTCPNLLRVLVGEAVVSDDGNEITVLETNLDDASPQVIGHCLERLLAEGALDAYAVPIQMKKWRPGVVLTVLCDPVRIREMERILFAETTTLGIRRHQARRTVMDRRFETVETPFGAIGIKIGELDGASTATPEYEDCKRAAQEHGVALRQVQLAAQQCWNQARKGTV